MNMTHLFSCLQQQQKQYYFLKYTKERWLNALDMLDAAELWTIQSDRELRENANTGQKVLWSHYCLLLEANTLVVRACIYIRICVSVCLSCDFTESPGRVRPCAGLLRAGNRSETKFALSWGSLNAKMCKKINRGLCLWVCVCASLGFLLVCNGIQERGLYCTVWGDSGGCVY